MISFSDLFEYQLGGSRATRKANTKDEEMELANTSPIFKKLRFRGWLIDPTVHAAAQALERRPGMGLDSWKRLHALSMNTIRDNDLGTGYYIFYSKSMRQGYVVSVNKQAKYFKILTVLPEGHNQPKKGTKLQLMESIGCGTLQIIDVD